MATHSSMPTITRKKTVPTKYNPNTFRVVFHDIDAYPTRYPDISKRFRVLDPLGKQLNRRPNILSHSTEVFPYPLYDYRANRPHAQSCGFLRHNYHTLNDPVCCVYTECQPKGHWIAPYLPPAHVPKPVYKMDTVSRQDFCYRSYPAQDVLAEHDLNKNRPLEINKVNTPWKKGLDAKEEGISFEHGYESRSDPNYPIRSKRHGAFVWKTPK